MLYNVLRRENFEKLSELKLDLKEDILMAEDEIEQKKHERNLQNEVPQY